METEILKASEHSIAKASELLKNDEIVAIPTETVYGLAANAYSDVAVKKVFAAKGRPNDNPLITHICHSSMLQKFTLEIPPEYYLLEKHFMPGALSAVLKSNGALSSFVTAGLSTVAVRMPSHKTALDIIEKTGLPLAAPSANISKRPSPTTAKHVYNDLFNKIPLIIDGGECEIGLESTVISLACDTPTILRPGAVTKEQLQDVLARLVLFSTSITKDLQAAPSAPGMKYTHYSPKTELVLILANEQDFFSYISKISGNFAVMKYSNDFISANVKAVNYGDEHNISSQQKSLFSALRQLDELSVSKVYCRVAKEVQKNTAVYNRLEKAASYKVIAL